MHYTVKAGIADGTVKFIYTTAEIRQGSRNFENRQFLQFPSFYHKIEKNVCISGHVPWTEGKV